MKLFLKIMAFLPGAVILFWGHLAAATQVFLQLPPEAQGLEGHLTGAASSFEAVKRENATPQDIMAAARADYGRLAGALYQVGHYGGVISILVDGKEVADISPFEQRQSVGQIIIRVQPGPLFRFSDTSIAPLAPKTELPEGFASGKPAYSSAIQDATRASVDAWKDVGHAKIEIGDQKVTADHRNAQLSAQVTLDPGPRLVFGDLIVNNSGTVRDERVAEIAGLPTGKLYTPKALKRSTERLRDTGAFSSIVLEGADTVRPVDTLDVTTTVADAKPRRIGFGAELSSSEGFSFRSFWIHRNLFGGAERLRFDIAAERVGGTTDGEDYLFSVNYERPATFSPDTTLTLTARIQQLETDDYRERSIRFGGGVKHWFSDKLKGELGILYQYSDVNDAFGSRTFSHIFFPGLLTYDSRDVELDATKGAFARLDFIPLIGLDNNAAGARMLVDLRNYTRLDQDARFIFATRAQLGSVAGATAFEVPPEMLFFSGGAGTVRGQEYQSLGIPLTPFLQFGGRSIVALSAELRAQVKGPWGVVGFVDYARIGEGSHFDGFSDDHAGAGVGVRYDTGIGPIRVDLAVPLISDTGNRFELYIGIGQAF